MSNLESNLYKEIVIKANQKKKTLVPNTKTYRGISSVTGDLHNPVLYDFQLIKQDLINHFHIRQGEKLSDPTFGTILWDVLFEPLTAQLKDLIVANVTRIISTDPRIKIDKVVVDAYETGILIDCSLFYLPYNVEEKMRLKFDRDAGFLAR